MLEYRQQTGVNSGSAGCQPAIATACRRIVSAAAEHRRQAAALPSKTERCLLRVPLPGKGLVR